jgi:hypothetical protein
MRPRSRVLRPGSVVVFGETRLARRTHDSLTAKVRQSDNPEWCCDDTHSDCTHRHATFESSCALNFDSKPYTFFAARPSKGKQRMKETGKVLLGGIFALTIGLGVLTLSPDPNDNGTTTPRCHARQIQASYGGAGSWKDQDVCDIGEVAISANGTCPASGSLLGVVLSADPAANNVLDRKVWLKCSTTGTADWNAACCPASMF